MNTVGRKILTSSLLFLFIYSYWPWWTDSILNEAFFDGKGVRQNNVIFINPNKTDLFKYLLT